MDNTKTQKLLIHDNLVVAEIIFQRVKMDECVVRAID